MRVVFAALVAAVVAMHEPTTVADIDAAIAWLTRSAPKSNPMQVDPGMRREVTISVHSAVRTWPVKPWLVLVVIHGESSFKMASKGADGERGLMQVNTGVFDECVRDGFNMDSVQGQVNCGTRHLYRQIQKYGGARRTHRVCQRALR